jgi:hypothetical protein
VQGFDLRVLYSTAKGTFVGSNENVGCTTDAAATFLASDNDQGRLVLIVASASDLAFPIVIRCGFSSNIAASDLTVQVHEVTQNDAPGDPAALSVGVTVEPAVTVAFDVTAVRPVQGFDLQVSYATARGAFLGSGENVRCTTDAPAVLVKNDDDEGTLRLIVENVSNLAFPVSIRCGFGARGDVTADDFSLRVREVTQNGVAVDPAIVSAGVTVR